MNKHNQNGSAQVAVIGVVGLVIVVALGYILWTNFISPTSPGSDPAEIASEKNLKLINDARFNKDPKICEKISGGIKAQRGSSLSPYGAFVETAQRDLTESEAQAQCKKIVDEFQNDNSTMSSALKQ